MTGRSIGLIAGNGQLPLLYARAARAKGFAVHAIGHRGETDPALEALVDTLDWVRLGQAGRMARLLNARGASQAVMAGGIGRARTFATLRPDLGFLQLISGLRRLTDDALLRAVAGYFERQGIQIVAATELIPEVLAGLGLLAGPRLSQREEDDVALGREVAQQLGRADVGQAVVVLKGTVLAVEAVEGTDAALRRGASLGGPGVVLVKRSKPGQDLRFDLPAAGARTLEVMREVRARVLAVEAHRTVLLDAEAMFHTAQREGISVVGF